MGIPDAQRGARWRLLTGISLLDVTFSYREKG